jgi:hypothetical protein
MVPFITVITLNHKLSIIWFSAQTVPAKIKGRAKKLDPSWKGPGIICAKLSSYVYKVNLKKQKNNDNLKLSLQ